MFHFKYSYSFQTDKPSLATLRLARRLKSADSMKTLLFSVRAALFPMVSRLLTKKNGFFRSVHNNISYRACLVVSLVVSVWFTQFFVSPDDGKHDWKVFGRRRFHWIYFIPSRVRCVLIFARINSCEHGSEIIGDFVFDLVTRMEQSAAKLYNNRWVLSKHTNTSDRRRDVETKPFDGLGLKKYRIPWRKCKLLNYRHKTRTVNNNNGLLVGSDGILTERYHISESNLVWWCFFFFFLWYTTLLFGRILLINYDYQNISERNCIQCT